MAEDRASLLPIEPAAPGERRELEPLSLSTACRRVGHCLDLWHSNPQKLLRILDRGRRAASHPLRGLFHPVLPLPRPGPSPWPSSLQAPSEFAPGQHVKVQLRPEVRSTMEKAWRQDRGYRFYDGTMEFEPATIVAKNRDGTYTVAWEAGYQTDLVQAAGDIWASEDGSGVDSVALHVLETMGSSGELSWTAAAPLLVSSFGIICLPYVLRTVFAKSSLCTESERGEGYLPMSTLCGLGGSSVAKHGIIIGSVCLMLCFAGAFIVFPGIYLLMAACCPVLAKCARQKFTTVLVDPIRILGLPTVYGPVEAIVAALFATAIVSGIAMTAFTLDSSLIPLTFLLSEKFLGLMNAFLGEKPGYKEIRKKCITGLLMEHLEVSKVDMSKEQLRHEVDRLLDLPANAGVAQLSIGLLTLIASICPLESPDSIRTRTFLTEDSYAAYEHKDFGTQYMKRRHDVVVDVFDGSCRVPGLTLVGERWCKEGHPLAWHLAVKAAEVGSIELELQELGLPPGGGCFTWRARAGDPAAKEALDPRAALAQSRRLAAEHRGVSLALRDLCYAPEIGDDGELTRPFLVAGADINVSPAPAFKTPLLAAATSGKAETIRALTGARADLTMVDSLGRPPLYLASRSGNPEAVKALIDARAELDKADKTGRTPLHGSALGGNVEMVRCLIAGRADLEKVDDKGIMPLSIAVYSGNAEAAKALVEARADLAKKDKAGRTSFEHKNTAALSILEEMQQFVAERSERRSSRA